MFTFYSVQRRNSGLKLCQLLCRKRRQDDVSGLYNFNFCVDVYMGLTPLPAHMRPSEAYPLSLLRVDVINGYKPNGEAKCSSIVILGILRPCGTFINFLRNQVNIVFNILRLTS